MLAVPTVSGWTQTRLSPGFHLQYADMAVLASHERRADFSCQVTPVKPGLGFDLRFHSDYRVTVPIKVLADVGGLVAGGYASYARRKQRRTGLSHPSVLSS